jgi:hypothetical protein
VFYLVDDLPGIDRRRPAVIDPVTRQRIDDVKGALDLEKTFDMFALDQAD